MTYFNILTDSYIPHKLQFCYCPHFTRFDKGYIFAVGNLINKCYPQLLVTRWHLAWSGHRVEICKGEVGIQSYKSTLSSSIVGGGCDFTQQAGLTAQPVFNCTFHRFVYDIDI